MYETDVERGVEFLDEYMPGWEEDIDVDALDMRSSNSCIVGQLLGGYSQLTKVFTFLRSGEMYGFALPSDTPYNQKEYVANEWQKLTEMWQSVVASRVEEKELVAV